MTFGGFAALCGVSAAICFLADRQVNEKYEDMAEMLAQEMEEAGDTDRIEIVVLPSGDGPPFPS